MTAAKRKSVKKNPADRRDCGWFTPPEKCEYPRADTENPQTTWYTLYYDCAICPATLANRRRYQERERESMRAYQ